MKKTLTAMLLAGSLFAIAMPAQEGKIAERKEHQQKRIAEGVKSGEMTAGETAHVEKKETNLNKEIHADRQANGGKLTTAQKKQVNHQQNKISRDIYKDKHDGSIQPR